MRQDGYTLVGVMVAVAVVNVTLAVAATSWVTLDRRAREAELIWRGGQIARGLECHRRTNPSEPPRRLEDLVESNCLRRLYPDPMARNGEWRVLTAADLADPEIAAILGLALPQPGSETGIGGPAAAAALRGGALGGSAAQQAILGVVSRAPGESLRLYNGHGRYAEWIFLASGQ